jgi:hypothetical protein
MQSAFYLLLGFGTFVLVVGGIIAAYALHHAPEGYEDEEGFVGQTKGDEILLKEFGHTHHYAGGHGSMDLAA